MVRRQGARGWLGGVAACLLLAVAASAAEPRDADLKPSARIPVEPFGFVPPPRLYLPYRVPSATLDFLDAGHLLLTFHIAALMHREPDEPKDDQDQTVRALVLSVPEGKVEAEATWRLHDRQPYLWGLTDGHFLLRRRNALFISDKSLVLRDYLHPEGKLASVQLSPDTGTLVAQFATPVKEGEQERSSDAPTLGDDAPRFPARREQYLLLVVDTRKHSTEQQARLSHAVSLPMVEGGYLTVEQAKGKQWNVLIVPFGGRPQPSASVASTCQPTVEPISEQAYLVQSCVPFSSDHLIDAFDLHGRKLWEQLWQSRFTWGKFAYSAAGNRFAYGSIEVDHNLATLDPVDESSILGQPVGVFNVETGKLDAVLDAHPVFTAGGNFALSPNGESLAILRDGAIEIYTLPPTGPLAAAKRAPEGHE